MFIVNHRSVFFTITGLILAGAIGAILVLGLPLGIDFTGGSLVEVSYQGQRPDLGALKDRVSAIPLGEVSLRPSGDSNVVLRTRTLTPEEHTAVLSALSSENASTTELAFTSVGPSLGSELGRKALVALALVVLGIMLYVAWAFRRVSRPVSSWVYGAIVVIILAHDILVPAGFYAILAHFGTAQVDALFVVALLAILGYSVNDTIVIFDRVREHLARDERTMTHETFTELVGRSISETLGRSVNTSLTVILALLALVFLGSPTTYNFALTLLVGVIAGTYSSILLAAPLLIPLEHWLGKGK